MSLAKENWLAHLQERAYVEQFDAEPVPRPVLEQILDSGRRTSSPWNLQPWQFIVVSSELGRARVLKHCHEPGPAAQAPSLIVGLGDPKAWKRAPERLAELMQNGTIRPGEEARHLDRIRRQWGTGDTSRVLAIAQTYAALQQVRLVALAFDVCSFWIHDFDAVRLEKDLHVPDSLVVVGILGLGFCRQKSRMTASSWKRFVFSEAYGLPWREEAEG